MSDVCREFGMAVGYLILTYFSQIGLARLEVYANRGIAERAPKAVQS